MIKIWLGSDHAGFELKKKIAHHLQKLAVEKHYEIHDLGTDSPTTSVDYPDFADAVSAKIHDFTLIDTKNPQNTHITEVGILVCGSAQGMAMRANKYPNVRAAIAWSLESATLSREHNDANILCLGCRLLDHDLALQMVDFFLSTPFAGGRHQARVAKISAPIA